MNNNTLQVIKLIFIWFILYYLSRQPILYKEKTQLDKMNFKENSRIKEYYKNVDEYNKKIYNYNEQILQYNQLNNPNYSYKYNTTYTNMI